MINLRNKLLLWFNGIGFLIALATYGERLLSHPLYYWPFIPTSAIVFGLLFCCFCCSVPAFVRSLTFVLSFSVGVMSLFVYPTLMYVLGFDWYLFVNLCTHGFFAVQAYWVLQKAARVSLFGWILVVSLVVVKDVLDLVVADFNYYTSGVLEMYTFPFVLIMGFVQVVALLYYTLHLRRLAMKS